MKCSSILLFCCLSLLGQGGLRDHIKADLSSFQSQDWKQRSAAFYDLTAVGCPKCANSGFPAIDGVQNAMRSNAVPEDLLKQGLIALLAREAEENESALATGSSLTEEYTDYCGDLVTVMTILKDKRSIGPLFKFVGSGNMAQDTLAGLGDDALKAAQTALNTEPHGTARRTDLLSVIHKMAIPKNLQAFSNPSNSRNAVKQLLIDGLSEPGYSARIEAVQGLSELGGKDVLLVLEDISATDNYSLVGPDGVRYYPVRREASEAIQRLSQQ